MGGVSDSPDTSVVTVLSDRSALEPKVCEDAACVASASTAALRPDRLLLATVALFLLWVEGSPRGDRLLDLGQGAADGARQGLRPGRGFHALAGTQE